MLKIIRRRFLYLAAFWLAAHSNEAGSDLFLFDVEPESGQTGIAGRPGVTDAPTPWVGVLLGILPFLLFGGAYLLAAAYELGWLSEGSAGLVRVAPLIAYGIISLGLILCWVVNFPRWSLAYLGLGLFLGNDYSHAQIYGVRYGLQGWLPLVSGLVVGLLVCQSFRPLLRLFQSIWNDWSRLSFGIYAYVVPVMTIIFFDSDWGRQEFFGLIFDTLLVAAGAAVFLRSRTTWKKATSLQAVMLVMLVRGVFMGGWLGGPARIASIGLPGLVLLALFWAGLMFVPAVFVLLRRLLGVDKFVGEV